MTVGEDDDDNEGTEEYDIEIMPESLSKHHKSLKSDEKLRNFRIHE